MALRYYVYISDAKVDMLLPQVDAGFARRRATEVVVSLKFVSARRSVETDAADRVARLERVVRYLDDFGDVGTVDEPGQYVRGRLPMRWGPLPLGPSPLVYFGGRTERTTVGLGGASGHVLGAPAPVPGAAPAEQELPFAPSTAPGLLAGLAAAVTTDGEPQPDALASVQLANRTLRGAEQEVEFLAKRLLHGPSPYPELDGHDGMTVLLASPLFVALAD
ncbi:DUF7019 family protein [Streptomyces sp. NPDC057877]|uniref:DUF7019 family protein n=1 Tax=Streptomyces sp. NPDC057877 TaxID=3346269 RepID=UPI003682E212